MSTPTDEAVEATRGMIAVTRDGNLMFAGDMDAFRSAENALVATLSALDSPPPVPTEEQVRDWLDTVCGTSIWQDEGCGVDIPKALIAAGFRLPSAGEEGK